MLKRDETHFGCFTRYRGSRQGLVQARTLARCSRKLKKECAKAHSSAERGRLRQSTSLRECASQAR